jgi:signal transduction histidine kinase
VQDPREIVTGSPSRIATTYALFGAAWIVATDWLVFSLVVDPARTVRLQTAKGWAFVAVSAGVIYALVLHAQHDLERTNEQLDTALRQASILHRILRHNLRNACTVIQGNLELAAERLDDEPAAHLEARLEAIEAQNEELVELSEKSKQLRDLVLGDPVPMVETDLVETIESQVETVRSEFPNADIRLDLPATLRASADPRVEAAIRELLTNAVEHGGRGRSTVRVRGENTPDNGVEIEIEDDGPGIPEMERAVLEEGVESPMFHSQGLGLWIAKTAARSDGDFELQDSDQRGTIARLSLPAGT